MEKEKEAHVQDTASVSATYAQMAKDHKQAARKVANVPQPASLADTLTPAPSPSVQLPAADKEVDAVTYYQPPKSLGELNAYLRKEIDDEPSRRREESRQRTRELIASIGDMGRAIANLGFTSDYAPNAYDHEKHSVTGRLRQRWEKAKADRLANRDRHLNRLMQIYGLEQGEAGRAYKHRRDAEADERARQKAQWEEQLYPHRVREQSGRADKAEYDALTAKAEADNAPALQDAKLKTEQAKSDNYRASAASHNRSNVAEFTAWDENGHPHKFHSKAAAELYSKQHGTWYEEDKPETNVTNISGGINDGSVRTTTKKKKTGYAAQPRQANPMDDDDREENPMS